MAHDEVGSGRSGDSASSRASIEEVLRALTDTGSRLEPAVVRVASPLGTLRLAAADGWLCLAEFIDQESHWGTVCDRIQLPIGWRFGSGYHAAQSDRPVLDAAARQLKEYFAGSRIEFKLPVWAPGRRLDEQVWHGLLRIPRGQAHTFAHIAEAIGRPAGGGQFRSPGGPPKPADDHHTLPPSHAQRRTAGQSRRRPLARTPSVGAGACRQTDRLNADLLNGPQVAASAVVQLRTLKPYLKKTCSDDSEL